MDHKTKKVCQMCGAIYEGKKDCHYCPKCAKEKKIDTVLKKRICKDCGIEFLGGPRAKRCPNCSFKAASKNRSKITKRPLGSTDKCVICGKEYIVKSGRQKYCSDECQRIGVLAWQREHKKGYNKASGQDIKRKERKQAQMKACVYCMRPFKSDVSTNLCSDYCRTEYKKLQMCKADIKRGQKRNLQKYIDAMIAYRAKVENEIESENIKNILKNEQSSGII